MRLTAKFGCSLLFFVSYPVNVSKVFNFKLSSSFVEYADVFGNHYSTGVSVTRNLVLKLYIEVRIIKIIVIILMIVIIIISSYDFLSVNDKSRLTDCYKGVFTRPALIQDKNIWYLGRCSNNIDESYKIYLFIFYRNKPSESSVLVYSIQDGRDSI